MKKENLKTTVGAGASARPTSKARENKGITLIALVITIIVMLILVAVTITMAVNGGLFDYAGRAATKTNEAKDAEQEFANLEANMTVNQLIEKYIGNSNGTEGETEPDDDSLTVADLVEGDYIDYIDKNGNIIECRVLYDSSSNYGVQIIALESVKQITLGGETVSEAIESYNNAIVTLNTAAEGDLNDTYATSARCVGSVPNNPSYESETYFTSDSTYFQFVNGLIKDVDENYKTDLTQINNLGIVFNCSGFFMASRFMNETPDTSNECVFGLMVCINGTDGTIWSWPESILGSENGEGYSDTLVSNVIPVFTLKSDVEISGEGTEDSPYEFK